MIELLLLPLCTGLLVALIAGPLGCFVVWNRMAYFSDTLAHSALLGVSLALLLSLPINLGIVLLCFAIAAALLLLDNDNFLPRDTLLGIFAHGALAAGIVASSFIEGLRIDLMAFLFGDVLSVTHNDVLLMLAIVVPVLGLLTYYWKALLLVSIDSELALVEGWNTQLVKGLLMFLLATVIAFSIKSVGVLLIGALLVIPAATARAFSSSPLYMVFVASSCAAIAVVSGLAFSWYSDAPAGPAMVLMSFALFVLSALVKLVQQKLA